MTAISLVPVEVTAPGVDEDHKTCPVCTKNRPPDRAYRPHTLDEECWCTRLEDGARFLATCWVFRVYLAR